MKTDSHQVRKVKDKTGTFFVIMQRLCRAKLCKKLIIVEIILDILKTQGNIFWISVTHAVILCMVTRQVGVSAKKCPQMILGYSTGFDYRCPILFKSYIKIK